jgi:glutamine---fructose-6-phosphate transaminase (isomerizing)
MCGIVAYLGEREAQPLLLEGLRRLEYRGYDSSGVAILNGHGIRCLKKCGRIQELERELGKLVIHGQLGISHTRWATHGEPSDANAHPHFDQTGKLALVHNGVIENYNTLRQRLLDAGHQFNSQTDTEILAHLIGVHYEAINAADPERLEAAVKAALREVIGTYGIAVMHADHPHRLIGARRGSPLVLGIGEREHFFSSDVIAIGAHAQKVVYLSDGDVVRVTPEGFRVTSLMGGQVGYEISDVEITEANVELGTFPHFMIKEIFEQPHAVLDAFRGRLDHEGATAKLGGLNMTPQELLNIDRIVIMACGTAKHAGMVGEYLLERYAHLPVEVDFASEFRYRNTPLDRRTLCIVVSQSGETLDTLGALREAQRKGFRVLGICNRVGSSIARETDGGVFMHAGPEIGVAATKSFTSQIVIFALLTILLGRMRYLSAGQGKEMLEALEALPAKISQVLELNDSLLALAKKYQHYDSMLFLGRQEHYPIALEGALKLKEVTYMRAEGHPSAELKHGIIALIDDKMPSLFICPKDATYDKNINNLQEVKARKGRVIAIATEGDERIGQLADDVIYIPATADFLSPILTVIPLQLFAYHMAVVLERDVDKPRNLAKSVTVE